MSIRQITLCASILLASFSSFAQQGVDKIFRKNGEVIRANSVSSSSGMVSYRLASNPDGPEYTISKGDIVKIRYASGGEQLFNGSNTELVPADAVQPADAPQVPAPPPHAEQRPNYGHNKTIIAFAPIQFTEHGYGFGLSWERTLDRAGWVSFYLPTMLTFSFITDNNSAQPAMFHMMPGVKVYTNLNSPQLCKFSIGPSLVLGAGSAREGNGTYYDPTTIQSHFLMGAMVNLGINALATPHLYLGAEWGLGITYLNQYNGMNHPVEFLTQIGFKIGYRYMNQQ